MNNLGIKLDSLTRPSSSSFPEGQSANFNINNRGIAIVEPVAGTSGNVSDEELVQASQNIEEALSAISDSENSQNNAGSTLNRQTINLPIRQSPGGSLQLTNQSFKPQSLFANCTFQSPVTIVLKHLEEAGSSVLLTKM